MPSGSVNNAWSMSSQKRRQKHVWLPADYWHQLKTYYAENQEFYMMLGIKSEAALLRVLANLGKQRLEQLLGLFDAAAQKDLTAIREIIEASGRSRSQRKEKTR